jgi:hypothetical protein
MRKTLIALLALTTAAPLAAQGGGGMAGMNMDPTTKIVGSGKLPDGWVMRFDPIIARAGRPTPPAPQMTEVNVVTMGSGLHFTTGPAAIYYRSADKVSGEYTVSATISQRKSMGHEAYGLFIGGTNLQDSTQNYLYFVFKPCRSSGDCSADRSALGEILISRRSSDARPAALVPITHDAAVNVDDATDGHATNKIAIKVTKDSVHFMLNDKQVRAFAKTALNGASTDGFVGLRINHNLDLHVADFAVKKP